MAANTQTGSFSPISARSLTSNATGRIKDYQAKVAELESETDRLSRALDAQKLATAEAIAAASKKAEDAGRELQKRVC